MRQLAEAGIGGAKTMEDLSQAGSVLEQLGSINDQNKMQACRVTSKLSMNELNEVNPQTVLHKAEVYRLFKCITLKDTVANEIDAVFQKTKLLKLTDDFYAAFILNKKASEYGVKQSASFMKELENQVTDKWLKQFDSQTWTLYKENGPDKKHDGVQLHAAKMTVIMSSLLSNDKVKKELEP